MINEFIEQQLPPRLLARLPKLFFDGQRLADQVVRENPCLALPSVQLGDIRSAGIEFVIQEHLRAKNYAGVVCGYCPFFRPTGKYFQIQTTDARITINHLSFVADFPRRAEFRSLARQGNHPDLFAEYEAQRKKQEADELALSLKRHLLITYGNRNLEFLQIGAMHPHLQTWLANPMNLLNRPHLVVDHDDDDTEAKDASIPMGLKEQFIQHISENASN
jgi:hypothetical protein